MSKRNAWLIDENKMHTSHTLKLMLTNLGEIIIGIIINYAHFSLSQNRSKKNSNSNKTNSVSERDVKIK